MKLRILDHIMVTFLKTLKFVNLLCRMSEVVGFTIYFLILLLFTIHYIILSLSILTHLYEFNELCWVKWILYELIKEIIIIFTFTPEEKFDYYC